MVLTKSNIAGFGIFYIGSIALVISYFIFIKNKSPLNNARAESASGAVQKHLMAEADLLFNQLKDLQKLDEKYAALFIQSQVTPAMDSLDTQISNKEFLFSNIVDSFAREPEVSAISSDKILFDKFTAFFKQTLENRRTIGNIRYALAAGEFNLDSGQQKWLKMNSDVIVKSNRIAELEKQLIINRNTDTSRADGNAALVKNLQLSLADEQKKNAALINANNTIRQNIISLNTELTNYRQSSVTAAAREVIKEKEAVKESSSTADNRVPDLNAELQLARVDCNLSRADVKQIISNSRQRKELLAQALNVLNTLTKSDNADIQNKARAKMRELYRITETVRD